MNKNEIKMSPSAVTALMKDERGMSTVEYVILLAVIVMGAVSIWTQIGGKVVKALDGSNEQIQRLPENESEAQAM